MKKVNVIRQGQLIAYDEWPGNEKMEPEDYIWLYNGSRWRWITMMPSHVRRGFLTWAEAPEEGVPPEVKTALLLLT